jgi:GntR family transcriptional regulator/MocR family aminotransferase
MIRWDVVIHLDVSAEPKFRQLAGSIAMDIERGRLVAGTKLPSSRALARLLGLNRSTVIAAYEELAARSWVTTEAARGTFVNASSVRGSASTPAPALPLGYPRQAAFDLEAQSAREAVTPRQPDQLLMLGGIPELRSLPTHLVARAYRQALAGATSRRLLDYGHAQGNPRLRAALADMVARVRGIAAPPEAITVVRGSQHGLYLAARTLLRPGDVVAVEAPGYRAAWRAFELAGATLLPIATDRQGLCVDALAAHHAPIRAIYTTPHHQYPTTVTLSPERRRRLLELAHKRRIIILEDDYDFDFHYDGNPVLPLACDDRHGSVVYFGTLSKSLAPGLRLGYVVAPIQVAAQIAAYRGHIDVQGDHVSEQAIAILLEEGEVQRHTRRMVREYRDRRDALGAELRRKLPELEFVLPSGGMAIWAATPDIDTDEWVRRGLTNGVAFQAGRRFTFDDQPHAFVRLGFAACTKAELAEAVTRMVRARPPR